MAGTLYVCATPIGNLEDITFRVLETLKRVDLIAAEDTRNSIHLLNHFEIKTPMTAYHEYNKYDKAKSLVQMLLDGKDIAIITDAGTPCISDPGEELVRQAAEAGITVTSLPGPAACITALTISALPTRRFAFEAFLPTEKADKKERARILEELKSETRTMIVYEAPRGEYVLVIEGKDPAAIQAETEASWNEMPLADHMQHYLDQGMPEKDAMKQVAKDRGISKRDVYQQWKVKS